MSAGAGLEGGGVGVLVEVLPGHCGFLQTFHKGRGGGHCVCYRRHGHNEQGQGHGCTTKPLCLTPSTFTLSKRPPSVLPAFE